MTDNTEARFRTAGWCPPGGYPGWCPPGGCPGWTREKVADALAQAFAAGRAYERAELAQLEATWKPIARATWEEQVARRIAELPGRNPAPPLRFDDPDWPAVAVPGGGGIRLGPTGVIPATPAPESPA